MLDKEHTGLIVVDIQGKLARMVRDSEGLIENCRRLILGAQALTLPVILLEQNPDRLGQTVDELQGPLSSERPIAKFTFDGCGEPQFIQAIENAERQSWLICGIEAHICVYQTALSLNARGYDVRVVADCVSSRSEANKQLALSQLQQAGVGLTGLEMCLYQLIKDCRANGFKDILRLVK